MKWYILLDLCQVWCLPNTHWIWLESPHFPQRALEMYFCYSAQPGHISWAFWVCISLDETLSAGFYAAISVSSVLQIKTTPRNPQNESAFSTLLRCRPVYFAGSVSFVPVSTPVPVGSEPPASGCSYFCCRGLSIAMDAHLGALDGKLEENWDLSRAEKNYSWHLQSLVGRSVTYWEEHRLWSQETWVQTLTACHKSCVSWTSLFITMDLNFTYLWQGNGYLCTDNA